MNLKRKYMEKLVTRSWEKLARGEVIIKKFVSSSDNGFLNSAKNVQYNPLRLKNCDIKLASMKKEETHAGFVNEADGMVSILRSEIERNGIDEISGEDMINIGGEIQGEEVLGGMDFRIKINDDSDCFFDDPVHVKLMLEKL